LVVQKKKKIFFQKTFFGNCWHHAWHHHGPCNGSNAHPKAGGLVPFHDATSPQPYFGHLRLFYPQIRFISIFISVKSHDHGPEHDRPPWSSSVNLETHGRLAAISVKSRLHARPPCHQSAPFLNPGSFTMCGKFRWIVMSLPFRLHGLPHVHSPIFKCF